LSTFISGGKTTVLASESMLAGYFASHAKVRPCIFVGMELEVFGVNRENGKALSYFGPSGIEAILKNMAGRFGYEPINEADHVIALKRDDAMITLEPGAQVELSAPPAGNVFEVQGQIQRFFGELREVRKDFPGIEWIAAGIQPYSRLDEIDWVPKTRYGIMAEYFKMHGTLSHEMMKKTATNQVNFDYLDEEDAMESLRVAFGITSIVTAMFANSGFSDGAPNGFLTRRLEIWNQTAPERAGFLPVFTRPNRTFADYLDYVLDMPMLFIVRDARWIPMANKSFRSFIHDGVEDWKATLEDFELHLSTAFPEVRLKQYLEIRGIDCQSPSLIASVAAFWKGLLYQRDTKHEAWKLVAFATEEERIHLHQEVPKLGLKAKLGKRPIFEIARELVNLACDSLSRQTTAGETRSECQFLAQIQEQIIRSGQCPAEQFLTWYRKKPGRTPAEIIDRLRIA